MKRIGTFLLLLFTALLSTAQQVNLDAAYHQLDEAIANSDTYLSQKNDSITVHQKQVKLAKTSQAQYDAHFRCYSDNRVFDNKAALNSLFKCLSLAQTMKRSDLVNYCNALIGHQYVVSGYFPEAEHYLGLCNYKYIPKEELNTYYYYKNHLYRELEMYSPDKTLCSNYHSLSVAYLDSVNNTLNPSDNLYYQRRCICLFYAKKYTEAMKVNVEWEKHSKEGTRSYANMAFYRSEIYKNQNNITQQKYWLAIAAISEIKSAVMNETALWKLADILNDEGDVDRAFKYVEYSWKSISRFSTHKRSWVVTPILTSISQSYRDQLSKSNNQLLMFSFAIGILLVFLAAAFSYVLRERKVTKQAQANMQIANEELSVLNTKLTSMNAMLSDSNRVKDQYITQFFRICSEYIEKWDKYRLRINRKLKANQTAEVLQITDSEELKKNELKMLLENFDSVFLNLFPSFVEEFNALLKPDCRFMPKSKDSLTTPLRIFALIRLGINDSSNIAEFLNYAPNSIYAYRARVKNGAIGNREEFENQVKQIGLS